MKTKQDNAKIYRDFEKRTSDHSAWVVLYAGRVVAKMYTYYGGRSSPNGLTVRGFVHILGTPMRRGIARGYGYDMRTAALSAACSALDYLDDERDGLEPNGHVNAFRKVVDQGFDVPHQLREMGYDVVQVL